jgi:hypothetical protein
MDNLRYSAEWARWRWVVAQVAAAWPTRWIVTRAGRVTAVSLRTSQHPVAVNDNRRQA